ncbi:MAG: nucleotidyltransferase family protein [Candidatus Aminicenantes bacterium]|nr:nucleotidyltransferase family protein [Candidatus Aminicenantes bacterium]
MEQDELLRHAARCFDAHGIRYFVTGAVAAIAYGEPRLTNDIDIVADLDEDTIPRLKSCYPADEFYFDEGSARRAVRTKSQFNIIHPGSGLKIDVMITQGDEFDQSRFRRARRLKPLEDTEVDFASPEDVVIKKLDFYRQGGSDKHLRDIAGILKISADAIDFAYIEAWAQKLGLEKIWAAVSKRTVGP